MREYDCIIIGAGSVGAPAALAMANANLNPLIIEENASVGQGDNKHAIGGIRATHTQKSKIRVCLRSIEIVSTWEEKYGENLDWIPGGYCFVSYTDEHEHLLKESLPFQKQYGLNINWVNAEKIQELIPGINPTDLRGGTYSPEDGTLSPLLTLNAFYQQAMNAGAEFRFKEKVLDIITENNTITGVKTTKGDYQAPWVINAAGAQAKNVGYMVGVDVPVTPDSHEAGITEPVQRFFSPMVVDIRPGTDVMWGNSKNYYFYQNGEGQIVFCLTPEPSIIGTDREETSVFLPQVAKRMITLLPRLKNIRIRRTWRGLYPMTSDGNPIIGPIKGLKGYLNAIGMCGQGFMIGPGMGEVLARIVAKKTTTQDHELLYDFSLYRDFSQQEQLK